MRHRTNKNADDGGVPDTKHCGGTVMVWECFDAGEIGYLYRVIGILNNIKNVFSSPVLLLIGPQG